MQADSSLRRRAGVHAALAETHRLAIVDDLALSDRAPSELRTRLGIESNLLAHHLEVLERAGLIERFDSRGDGRRRYVRLIRAPLRDLLQPRAFAAARLMFVCTQNSARSQLAAAMWNAATTLPATSAGTHPASRVHPEAVRAARRRGLDLRHARPARIDLPAAADTLLVTVCDLAHEELTSLGLADASLHWSVDDPAEAGSPEAFERAADALAARVEMLVPLVSTSEPKVRRRSR